MIVSGLVPIDEAVHFDICTHDPTTGGISDADATPTFDVYEEATDTGLLGATNFTKRTSLTGDYRGTFTASAANGFEAGKWYSIIASATVGGVSAKKNCGSFRVSPAEAVAGVPKVDVDDWKGATAPAMTGDAYARLGAPAGASVSADVAAVKVDTAAILVDTGTDIPASIDALPTAAENAVAVMTPAFSTWEDAADVRSLAVAGMKATHKIAPSGATLQIFKNDNTTVKAEQALTTDATLEPVKELGGTTAP